MKKIISTKKQLVNGMFVVGFFIFSTIDGLRRQSGL
jgi:hypothetical protein